MPKTIKGNGPNTNPDKDTYTVRVYKKLKDSGSIVDDNYYPYELHKIYSEHPSIPMVDKESDYIEVEIPKIDNNFSTSVANYFSEGEGKNISGYIDYPFSKTGTGSDMYQPLHDPALASIEDDWKTTKTYDRSGSYGVDGKDSSGEVEAKVWYGPFKPVNMKQPDGMDTEDGDWTWKAENWREGDWEKPKPPPPPLPPPIEEQIEPTLPPPPPPPPAEEETASSFPFDFTGLVTPPPSDWTGPGRRMEQRDVNPYRTFIPEVPSVPTTRQGWGGRVKVLKSR